MTFWIIFCMILGYLIGALPFAVIISQIRGVDIRRVGTKNPGAANVFRNVGKFKGILVWLLDTLKGVAIMAIGDKVFNIHPFWVVMCGMAAVIGHCWSCFLKFEGGRGASTAGGVLFYIVPKVAVYAIVFFFLLQIKKLRTGWTTLIGVSVFGCLCWLFYRAEGVWLLWAMLILVGLGTIINIPTIKELSSKKG